MAPYALPDVILVKGVQEQEGSSKGDRKKKKGRRGRDRKAKRGGEGGEGGEGGAGGGGDVEESFIEEKEEEFGEGRRGRIMVLTI